VRGPGAAKNSHAGRGGGTESHGRSQDPVRARNRREFGTRATPLVARRWTRSPGSGSCSSATASHRPAGAVGCTTYYLERLQPKKDFDVLGLGLAGETLSGLSEEGHAGGKFPRPCVFERLGRPLK